ncbi:unnamed protein product [Allacma fusca]|uniref:DNA-directed RNA polymerase III subunit RPC8 n=2 Tax=Allacma fusca TaxID=39272 RepID=A0A8J2MCH1_9HEXA|nr:unnamed protein product [Allacma fusca]
MFVLYEFSRTVRIDPKNLTQNRKDAITDELNRLFANRVIIDVGLCMALWDIKSIGLGSYFPGDGGVHSPVDFRFIVFRPFQDEILVGKIKNCTREGVHVTLGFFDDILIPPEGLQFPSKFDEREQTWVWEYQQEGEEVSHDLYMDKGQQLKCRIIGEQFDDMNTTLATVPPTSGVGTASQPGPSTAQAGGDTNTGPKVPFMLTASINEPGLGLLSWWD